MSWLEKEWQERRDALWTSLRKIGDGDWTPQDVRAQAHLEASTNYIGELGDWKRLALDMGEALRTLLAEYEAEETEHGFPFNLALRDAHRQLRPLIARLDGLAAGKGETE